MKKKLLIIGNSAAATGALEAIRRHDLESSVTIVSDENYPLYSRCLLSYFIAGKIDERRLLTREPNFHREMNAELLPGKKVVAVDPAHRQVSCDDGTRLGYDQLLIATGAAARLPASIPAGIDGVFVLRSVADAQAIRKRVAAGGNAVVLGGGLVGMKASFALAQRGMNVTVVLRSPHVLSQMIDFDAAQIVEDRLRKNKIDVLAGADIASVEDAGGKLVAVKTDNGKTLPCDLLIVAKGVEPNTQLVGGTGIEKRTGLVTNSRLQTNLENIYAAGDVAETYDIARERHEVNALWTSAVQQGKVAGLNMAGQDREYDGSVGMNAINFPRADLISFGVVRPAKDADYEVLTDNRPQAGVYRKVVLKDNRIKGLILVNRIDTAGVLLSLLSRKVDVGAFKDELLSDRFNYARVLGHSGREEWQRFWNAGHAVRS